MSKKIDKKEHEQYLAEARSWETDKIKELKSSKKIAWRIATGACVLAVLSVGAVFALTPLKKSEPYVVKVDNSTGIVEVVSALKDTKLTYDEALNKYFTQWYVRYREGYTRELAPDYYVNVGYLSSTNEQRRYYDWFTPKNPLSPLKQYGDKAKVRITIKGTSFIKENVALVRYMKAIERGSDRSEITHWAATITFKYSGSPMDEKARGINPLGFQVIDYRNDPESLINDSTIKPAEVVNAGAAAINSAFANPNAQPVQSQQVAPVVPAPTPIQQAQ